MRLLPGGADHAGLGAVVRRGTGEGAGGQVVAASTERDGLTVNGMSYSHRGEAFCNSTVVVESNPAPRSVSALAPKSSSLSSQVPGVMWMVSPLTAPVNSKKQRAANSCLRSRRRGGFAVSEEALLKCRRAWEQASETPL